MRPPLVLGMFLTGVCIRFVLSVIVIDVPPSTAQEEYIFPRFPKESTTKIKAVGDRRLQVLERLLVKKTLLNVADDIADKKATWEQVHLDLKDVGWSDTNIVHGLRVQLEEKNPATLDRAVKMGAHMLFSKSTSEDVKTEVFKGWKALGLTPTKVCDNLVMSDVDADLKTLMVLRYHALFREKQEASQIYDIVTAYDRLALAERLLKDDQLEKWILHPKPQYEEMAKSLHDIYKRRISFIRGDPKFMIVLHFNEKSPVPELFRMLYYFRAISDPDTLKRILARLQTSKVLTAESRDELLLAMKESISMEKIGTQLNELAKDS